jgi:hypothetical protein
MSDPPIVQALVKKRAELSGDIETTHASLKRMIADVEKLDADPTVQIEAIQPKAFRPPADWAKRGEMSRVCLDILGKAAEPMTTRDIAFQLLIERALDNNDLALLRLMTKRVRVAMRGQRDMGTVRSEQGPGQHVLWEVASPE